MTSITRSVEWWRVHLHLLPLLQEVGCWPMAGTITWQQLEDQDPVKLASLLDAARHHVLRVDTAQTALAEASREISKSADWSQISRTRSGVYIPREVA